MTTSSTTPRSNPSSPAPMRVSSVSACRPRDSARPSIGDRPTISRSALPGPSWPSARSSLSVTSRGTGTDSSERGRTMWARVKGATENALLALPFKAAYMFRPGFIQPRKGVRSRTPLYQAFYSVAAPLYPLLRRLAPDSVTTTVDVGRALIEVSIAGYPRRILETVDINRAVTEKGERRREKGV
jgi:hypothetical protein